LPHAHTARELLAGEFVERRLIVQQVHLRRAARLMQEDHALGFRREVRQARESRSEAVLREQRAERRDADAVGGARKEGTAGDLVHRYSLVMTSSRLRMVLAIMVHAASSGPFSFAASSGCCL